jgi:hypothetical protein
MTKDKKNGKADKKAEKETAAQEREFKFGVEDIADKLGIKPASVRVQLRNKGIEKAGKSYGWDSKSELNEVIDQIRSNGDGDAEEKPAKKSKKDKKADKSSKKSKKSKKDDDDE